METTNRSVASGSDDVNLIFLQGTTYVLAATMLPVVRRAKVPVIILNLQPAAALDYERFNPMATVRIPAASVRNTNGLCPINQIEKNNECSKPAQGWSANSTFVKNTLKTLGNNAGVSRVNRGIAREEKKP